ncbi:MAG: DUF362 domain-containing protein [Sedimentisphaerales bacterium]|nr:DUF362 domain-containing protein [Sedimentisphaerales bacterium]
MKKINVNLPSLNHPSGYICSLALESTINRLMSDPTVTLIKCDDYSRPKISDAIKNLLSLLGGLEKFVRPGDKVLLKPNFIAPKSRHHATQTDPAIIIETARLLIDFGAKPFVADSPAWSDVHECIGKLKLEEPLRKLSVPVKQLDKPKKCRIGAGKTAVMISTVALEADVIINLPKFKSHQQLLATFAVKNMFGCVSGKRKALMHFKKGKKADVFCRMLIDIYQFLNPALNIIDAVTVMDGPGPINGRARPLGWLLAGTDPIACETVCARLVGIEPETLPMIKTAKNIGFGCSNPSKINIKGDNFPEPACTDFQLPKLIPIRFSLPHVCKSVCKQGLLIAKTLMKKMSSRDISG